MRKMNQVVILTIFIFSTTVLSYGYLSEAIPVDGPNGSYYCSMKGQANADLTRLGNVLDKMLQGCTKLTNVERWKLRNDDGTEWMYQEDDPSLYDWMVFRFTRSIYLNKAGFTRCYWKARSVSSSTIYIHYYVFNGDHSHFSFNSIDSSATGHLTNFIVSDTWWTESIEDYEEEELYLLIVAETETGDGVPPGDLDNLFCDVMTVHTPEIAICGIGVMGGQSEGLPTYLLDDGCTAIDSASLGEIKAVFK